MAVEKRLLPPQDAGVENEIIGFDYGLVLDVSESIDSVVSVTCTVNSGVDPNPSQRLGGGQTFIVPSTRTGAPNGQVNIMFGGALDRVSYRLQCVVLTRPQGQRLSEVTYISGQAPP